MRRSLTRGLPLFALGCTLGPLTNPCFEENAVSTGRCTGTIAVDVSDIQQPTFTLLDAEIPPTRFELWELVDETCGDFPARQIWQLGGFETTQLPVVYGLVPEGTRELTFADIQGGSPSDELLELVQGRAYEARFNIGGLLDQPGLPPEGWTATFRPGEPDSVVIDGTLCSADD